MRFKKVMLVLAGLIFLLVIEINIFLTTYFPGIKFLKYYSHHIQHGNDLNTDSAVIKQIIFDKTTFTEEMSDFWNRVDHFNNHILPSVPKKKLRTRKMKANYSFFDFNNLHLIQDFIQQKKTLKITSKNMFFNDKNNEKHSLFITDDKNIYFKTFGNATCFIEGTRLESWNNCLCAKGWFGNWCSFPEVMQNTAKIDSQALLKNVKPKSTPRRIINLLTFSMEFEMLLIRLGELGNIIDGFIILESNITSYGDPKPLYLYAMMKRGFIEEYHHKILYTQCKHFLTEAYLNGWLADDHLRGQFDRVMSHQIYNLRDDDIIMYNDADEIPSREALLFLKLHTGYPEKISINFDKRTYGFFWRSSIQREQVYECASSFGVYKNLYLNHTVLLRNSQNPIYHQNKDIRKYQGIYDLRQWGVGKGTAYAGWHCSGCMNAESLRIKMQSALNQDYPRWGDNPETFNLERLKNYIIGEGHWFDGESLVKADNARRSFAPTFVSHNPELFKHLFKNPYELKPS